MYTETENIKRNLSAYQKKISAIRKLVLNILVSLLSYECWTNLILIIVFKKLIYIN